MKESAVHRQRQRRISDAAVGIGTKLARIIAVRTFELQIRIAFVKERNEPPRFQAMVADHARARVVGVVSGDDEESCAHIELPVEISEHIIDRYCTMVKN
jgi:4-aminobutyrate aminotransferase-like enzyme